MTETIENYGLKSEVLCVSKLGCTRIIPTAAQKVLERDGTHFLNPKFGPVAIIRPTSTKLGGAQAAVNSYVNDGLFRGQKPLNNPELVRVLLQLAEDADNARRQL